jgi:hypothetical protein
LAAAKFSCQSREAWAAYCTRLAAALGASASLAFLISNGSFFWFSGKVSSVGFFEYAWGLSGQYLPYVGVAALYAMVGLGLEVLVRMATNTRLGGVELR